MYLVFLLAAFFFWIIMKGGEGDKVTQVKYNLQIVNLPNGIVITSKPPKQVYIEIKTRGYNSLLTGFSSFFGKTSNTIEVEYNQFKDGIIEPYRWKEILRRYIPEGAEVVSAEPSNLEISAKAVSHRYIPVAYEPHIRFLNSNYRLFGMEIRPSKVNVTAPQDVLDSLAYIYVADSLFTGVHDSLEVRLPLKQIANARLSTDSVTVKLDIDLVTERKVRVPIEAINVPKGVTIRIFPYEAEVSFKVRSSLNEAVDTKQFQLTVDYNSLSHTASSDKCELVLLKKPNEAMAVQYKPSQVECVTEQ